MKLLLDTSIWLQSNVQPGLLSRRVARAIANPSNEVWLSPVSVLEFISLCEKKRYRRIADPVLWIRQALVTLPVREAPLTIEIASECGLFEMPTADPADRIIVATARVLGCTLVTSDQHILKSGVVKTLPAA